MTMNEDFEIFQQEFYKWQKLFGLTGYFIYFKYEPLCENFADIVIDHQRCAVTVRLNSDIPNKNKPFLDVNETAKHEAIHLLVSNLEDLGYKRYVTEDDIRAAAEQLVNKLATLIS